MYSRIYNSGSSVRVPPDYSGNAINVKHHPPEFSPSPPPPPEPIRRDPPPPPPPPPPCGDDIGGCKCENENAGGPLKKLLSELSADDLIIYGAVIFMTLSDKDNDMILLILLLLVLL